MWYICYMTNGQSELSTRPAPEEKVERPDSNPLIPAVRADIRELEARLESFGVTPVTKVEPVAEKADEKK